jgi:L-ascorbate metabolism protein UlaG (beta-lactamase superfamily)
MRVARRRLASLGTIAERIAVNHLTVAAVLLAVASVSPAQDLMLDTSAATQPATQPAGAYVLTEPESKHLERQAVVSLGRVNTALNAFPPTTGDVAPERAMALTLLDAILHEPGAPQRPAVGEFRRMRTQLAIDDIRRTKVTGDDAVVWQIYNMGFVVRTRSVTMAFDLVKLVHVPAVALDDTMMRAIADECDVLFVSHEHLDHSDREVSEMFLSAGKPVVAPESMWQGEPIHARLTHLPRDGDAKGHTLPVRGGALNVAVFPGHQTAKQGPGVDNNVYVVTTAEGLRVGHTGDNNVEAGLPDPAVTPVDLLVMKLMPGKLGSKEILAPFRPRVVLPSHFEELGHVNVNAREPFWRGLERAPGLKKPTLIMMWGERFDYALPTQ